MKYKVTYVDPGARPDEEIEEDQIEVRSDFIVFYSPYAVSFGKGPESLRSARQPSEAHTLERICRHRGARPCACHRG